MHAGGLEPNGNMHSVTRMLIMRALSCASRLSFTNNNNNNNNYYYYYYYYYYNNNNNNIDKITIYVLNTYKKTETTGKT